MRTIFATTTSPQDTSRLNHNWRCPGYPLTTRDRDPPELGDRSNPDAVPPAGLASKASPATRTKTTKLHAPAGSTRRSTNGRPTAADPTHPSWRLTAAAFLSLHVAPSLAPMVIGSNPATHATPICVRLETRPHDKHNVLQAPASVRGQIVASTSPERRPMFIRMEMCDMPTQSTTSPKQEPAHMESPFSKTSFTIGFEIRLKYPKCRDEEMRAQTLQRTCNQCTSGYKVMAAARASSITQCQCCRHAPKPTPRLGTAGHSFIVPELLSHLSKQFLPFRSK